MYYENVFYDDVINRLANILITTYHECQPKSKSKSQVKNEILEAISSEPNFYKILDVSKTANHSALKKAYYKISLICHPDKHPDNVEKAAEIFKKVSDAYITLSDPEKRKIYDSINHNIIENEDTEITGAPDAVLFRQEDEKALYEQINEIRKAFTIKENKKNYENLLFQMSGIKAFTDNFFDNVKVNDENKDIKKNRLELLKMFCNTFNNFINFSKLEGL